MRHELSESGLCCRLRRRLFEAISIEGVAGGLKVCFEVEVRGLRYGLDFCLLGFRSFGLRPRASR